MTPATPLRRLQRTVAPIIALLLLVAVWQGGVIHALLNVREFTLPTLFDIVGALVDERDTLLRHARTTIVEAGIGYVIGSTGGFLLALGFLRFPRTIGQLRPAMSGLNSTPVVALAPLAVLWLGIDIVSKIAVVVLMTLAPMAVSASKGLGAVDNNALELMRSYAATDREVLLKLRLPTALPYIFTALKLNVTLALIGAIVAEFFSSLGGLGFFMSRSLVAFDMAVAWSTMAVAGVVGVAFYLLASVVERLAIPWHASIRDA
jgi:NitT/TauT family transport system permease protein